MSCKWTGLFVMKTLGNLFYVACNVHKQAIVIMHTLCEFYRSSNEVVYFTESAAFVMLIATELVQRSEERAKASIQHNIV